MRALATPARQVLTPLQSLIIRRWRPQWIQRACLRQPPVWLQSARAYSTTTDEKPYYVTTPIFYVNASPHVGHMYNMVLTDVLKRWQQLKGRKAILCTGTDEHGLKMQQAAAKADVEPQALCDLNARTFKDLAVSIDISNDIFMRTTSEEHKEAVRYAWQLLIDRGYIYESKHEGWYSVSDETFYPKSQVHLMIEPTTGRKIMASIETGKEVEWTSERNYHFRLSAFRDKLLAFYNRNPGWILPNARMQDMVREVTNGLQDLSVSRPASRLTWGIRVPGDETQTIYVWLDALLNYATAAGYPFRPGKEAAGGWPADVHVIGKDIMRFHCIYWPAFLMALDLPLPGNVLTHAHWTLNRQKMAKSTGNVVDPFFALDRFGVDAMRWYLIHDGGIDDDADYDNGYIVQRYKKGLQGGLGGLANRVLKGKGWDVKRAIQDGPVLSAKASNLDLQTRDMVHDLDYITAEVTNLMDNLRPDKGVQRIMELVYNANAYIQHTQPWRTSRLIRTIAADTTGQLMHDLEGEGQSIDALDADMHLIIYRNLEALRISGILLQPFMPTSAGRLLDLLGVAADRRSLEWCKVGKDVEYGSTKLQEGNNTPILFPPLMCET